MRLGGPVMHRLLMILPEYERIAPNPRGGGERDSGLDLNWLSGRIAKVPPDSHRV
jgi:hypothetical protein